MAKTDPETGNTPVATDGEPDAEQKAADNEMQQRRALKEARERAEEEATGMTGKRGNPIDSQPDVEDEDDMELFPLGTIDGDPKVTHRNMIRAGMPVKIEAKMSNAAVPMTQGLFAFGHRGEVLVTFEAGAYKPTPEFAEEDSADGTRKVKGVKIIQNLRAVHVRAAEQMYTLDQVLDILEVRFALPRSSDKVREVFGLDEPKSATG